MQYCADPSTIEGFNWWVCYLSSGKHQAFYMSLFTVLLLLVITAPLIMILGIAGAIARFSKFRLIRWGGVGYTNLVRGVPDIVFFLFVPIAMDQGIEYLLHKIKCPEVTEPIRQGSDFVVCSIAKMPLNSSPQWIHEIYGFLTATVAFALVFGAFAANTLYGAMKAVPRGQLETGEAYGMTPRQVFWRIQMRQMWVFALPGLANLWMILIKASPLLFLLGVEDIVYWAKELGGAKTSRFDYPHPDWRVYYFAYLMVFYLFWTWVSEKVFLRLSRKLSFGQATLGGEADMVRV